MKVIIDSNVLIGARLSNDQHHKIANALLKLFAAGEIVELYTTNYVVVECINFILRKRTLPLAHELYLYLTKAERISCHYMAKGDEQELYNLFTKYKTLSLTDCSLVLLAKKLKVDKILSFDAGFDKVKGIVRISNADQLS